MRKTDDWSGVLLLIWSSGSACCFVVLCVRSARFRRRLRCCAVVGQARRYQLLEQCGQLLGVRRSVRLLEVAGLRTPAQMGLFRPTVLLPTDLAESFTDEQLRHVFLHELAHVKRCDVLANGLLAVLRMLHWWNPLYWLVQSRLIVERELACDASVLQSLAPGESRSYGSTLLEVVSGLRGGVDRELHLPPAALGFVPFTGGKSSFRRRIRLLGRVDPVELKRSRVLGFCLTLALLIVGCTDGKAPESSADGRAFSFPAGTSWSLASVTRVADQQLITRVYAVEDLLETLAREEGGSIEGAMNLLEVPMRSICAPSAALSDSVRAANTEEPVAGPHYEWNGRQLVVSASQEQHEALADLLTIWQEHGPQQITLEVRLMSASEDHPLPVGAGGRIISPGTDSITQVSGAGSRDDSLVANATPEAHGRVISERRVPIYVQTLSSGLHEQVIYAAQSDSRSNIMMAPKVTLFNGQQATVSSVIQHPFVTGLDSLSGNAQPQIEVVEDGFTLQLTAISDAATGSIHLDCDLLLSEITDVTTASVPGGDGVESLTVQVPVVESQQYSATGELADGESLLLSPLHVDDSGARLYVVVTARRVGPDLPAGDED